MTEHCFEYSPGPCFENYEKNIKVVLAVYWMLEAKMLGIVSAYQILCL